MSERQEYEPGQPERGAFQTELLELTELQESFGFIETEELAALHAQIVEAAKAENADLRRELTAEYQDTAVASVGDDPPDDLRHGFALALAAIKLEAGYDFAGLDDMQDVLEALRYVPKYDAQTAKLDMIMQAIEQPE